jgi:3-hydroxymyristoyl/3-hydroxydecanoyl-(acyl carrier protein) dehydratase
MNSIVCYSKEGIKTKADFLRDISALREFAIESKKNTYILHSENLYYFAVAFTGILQAKKTLAVSANISPEFIREICEEEDCFIPEEQIRKVCCSSGSFSAENGSVDLQADVVLWTSGTTGTPKKVHKKFEHLNIECEELAGLWGDEAKDCLFCETVSHHHIYGLLVSFLLPLRLEAPFLAEKIEMPEALEEFRDKNLILVSSPAFLKRIPENCDCKNLQIAGIFCSGGSLPFESAKNAERFFGRWPVEIYGSTETGGIAHRISKNGPEWQPFSVCSLSLANNGCLRVKSPYVAEKNGFVTGDMAEFLDNGKFVLNGRADSIVKIEEKRISLPEVEMRILSCGLVQEACVLALSGKRQYLAAAVILNEKGKEQFSGASNFRKNSFFRKYLAKFLESAVIPKKWRYLESFAQDTQGKIKRKEIEKLFFPGENYQVLSVSFEDSQIDEKKIFAELFFPESSDFFDGHFPQYSLLPAVAQVGTVIKIFEKFFNSHIILKKISRVKFITPIRPNTQVQLHICYLEKEKTLNFEFFGNKKYSSGTFFCG